MIFCTDIAPEERCTHCPLTQTGAELQEHQLFRIKTETVVLLGAQDERATKESYIDDLVTVIDELEPADQHLYRTIRDIANLRMIGACEYHEGATLEDPEAQARFNQAISKLVREGL